MTYLLDTNVVSEARKGARCHPDVAAWLEARADSELFISVLVLGEIRRGVELLRARHETHADALETWLHGLVEQFSDRIIDIDAAIAERWGRLGARRTVPAIDGLLAATALVKGMTLVTRNTSDIADLGVPVLNPFGAARDR